MSNATVSVIMPVYNRQDFLLEATTTINQQTYKANEIIIVDDGSTDNTAKILAQISNNLIIIRQSNQGAAAARNTGIKHANSKYLAFLDSDDLWPSNRLKQHVEFLEANPNIDIAQGIFKKINLQTGETEFSAHPHLASILLRKEIFEEVGNFDVTLSSGEDTDWFLRALEANIKKHILNSVSLYYRIHSDNMTNNRDVVLNGFLKFLKRHLHRVRQGLKQHAFTADELGEYFGFGEKQLQAIRKLQQCETISSNR